MKGVINVNNMFDLQARKTFWRLQRSFLLLFLTVLCTSAGSSNTSRHFDNFSMFFFSFLENSVFVLKQTAHTCHSPILPIIDILRLLLLSVGFFVLVDLLLRVSHQFLAPEVKLFTWTGSPHLAVKMLRGDALTHAQWDGCGPEGRHQAVNVARCYNCSFKVIHFKWLI